MVEIFRTNVTNEVQAQKLVGVIEDRFEGYRANFDLDDHDNILRIEVTSIIDVDVVVNVLKEMGVSAEVLPDVVEDVALIIR